MSASFHNLEKNLAPTSEIIISAANEQGRLYNRPKDIVLQLADTKLFFEENLFRFMITEVIENAVKYSHPNSIVSVPTKLNETNFIITVEDKGLGIS